MENKKLKSFKDLTVWQKSADLATLIYKITEKFPRSELYGIVNQMRRAVVSVSSNLAEGFKRSHNKEKLQFYNIAYGSASELESQIEISKKLGFLSENDYQILILVIIEVSKMIGGLIKSLNSKFYILNSNSGAAALPTIIIVAMIILLAGIGAASSGFVENLISYSELESKKALFSAEAGAKDAFKRIGRNKDCNIGGSATCASYSISVGDATSTVAVSGSNNKTILSSGLVGNIEVKIQVETYFDANNKLIQSSWKQID